MLENIARGGPEEGANDEGAGDENDESGARRNKRGQVHTTASSIDAVDSGLGVWTPGAGTTLEKDRASLLQSHVDTGVVVDPLFSKMSGECGGGSEGGAAGLLLARLPVLGGCMLSFGSGAGADDVDAAPAAGISIVGAAAALDPTLTFALRGLWARAVNLSVDATPSALAARLRALQLAPSIEPLYAALATHTGKAMVAAPPPSAAVSAPPPALLSVQDDAGTASWAASAALAAAAAPVLMSPVSPAASAAERATRTSPFASLDAAALAHAAAVALPLSFAGDADDDANLDWGDEVAGSADGAVAAAPTIDADADETGDSSAEVAWQAVVVETAASARAPSSALLLASFEDADDSAGTGAVPVDLAALAMVPTAVARAGRPPQGAGAAWKPRGATAAATQEAIKKRAPAKRATPRISSADYAVVGAAPPAEMWALGSRAALSLSASARTKMAAAVAAGSADLPPHARLALAATASGVTPANELARWLRFCLREAPKVAAGSWPNDRAPTCATSPALVAALSPQRDATHEDYDDGGDAGGDGGGWSADEWRDAAAPKGGAAMTQGPPAADSPPGSPTIAAAAANEPSLEGPIMDAQRPEGHLVAAGRIVEKIRVRFETTSKRVDVALLKSGFWDALGTARGSGALGRVKHKDVEIAARRGAEARASTWEDASGAARGADKTQSAAAPLVGELTGTALPFSSVIRSLAPANSSQVTVSVNSEAGPFRRSLKSNPTTTSRRSLTISSLFCTLQTSMVSTSVLRRWAASTISRLGSWQSSKPRCY